MFFVPYTKELGMLPVSAITVNSVQRVTISSIGSGQLLNREGGRFRIYTRTGDKGEGEDIK